MLNSHAVGLVTVVFGLPKIRLDCRLHFSEGFACSQSTVRSTRGVKLVKSEARISGLNVER